MTRYGQEACQKLVMGLHTLALPGSGLGDDVIYPRSNRAFAKELLERGGGMLSEYPPDTASRVHFFPERNRLMVALADAVLIVEAGPKSGTLITTRLASEYNRDLLAVPHRIGDPHAFGPHLFIRLGAALVSDPLHILEALHIAPRESGCATPGVAQSLDGADLAVWELLEEPHERDAILREIGGPPTGLGMGEVLTALVSLELRGLIREEFGLWRRI